MIWWVKVGTQCGSMLISAHRFGALIQWAKVMIFNDLFANCNTQLLETDKYFGRTIVFTHTSITIERC
jgi:hypothetical protein